MNSKYIGKTPEEILSMLTLRQKISQLISTGIGCWDECEICLKQGVGNISAVWGHNKEELERFRQDIERLQEEADIPYLVGVDMETGVGQTVHEKSIATEFAEQMTFGAIADRQDAIRLAYEEGKVIAAEASALGWNYTYGPVVDVNINPANPITNIRSFGEKVETVAELSGAMIRGLQEGHRLLACAKHFPGAGMQAADSHFALERTKSTREEMDATHLMAFRKAIENGVQSVMCNHAIYPMYDEQNVATISKAVMTGILRDELGFKGIAITDAMGMAGLTAQDTDNKHMGSIRAINAGCDILLGPWDAWNANEALEKAVRDGLLSEDRVNESALRVLKAKAWLGLFDGKKKQPLPRQDGWSLAREISKKSLTKVWDKTGLVPIQNKDTAKVLVLEPTHPGEKLKVGLYSNVTLIHGLLKNEIPTAELDLFEQEISEENRNRLLEKAKAFDVIIVGTSFRSRSGQVGLLTDSQIDLLRQMHEVNPNIIAVVSNPYVSAQLRFIDAILCCYSTSQVAVEAAVNVLCGKEEALGKLDVTIPEKIDTKVEIVSHG